MYRSLFSQYYSDTCDRATLQTRPYVIILSRKFVTAIIVARSGNADGDYNFTQQQKQLYRDSGEFNVSFAFKIFNHLTPKELLIAIYTNNNFKSAKLNYTELHCKLFTLFFYL
jgi:hypothetical protein